MHCFEISNSRHGNSCPCNHIWFVSRTQYKKPFDQTLLKVPIFRYARKLVDESTEPDLVSSSAFISGYSQNGFGKEAILAFYEMHLSGVKCYEFTILSVLKACTVTKDLWPVRQVYGTLVVTGFENDEFVAKSLLVLYAKCGEFVDSRKLFDAIPQRSVDAIHVFEEIEKPDIVSWNVVIAVCVFSEYHHWTIKLFGKTNRLGICPNMYTISSALYACAGMGLWEIGRQLHSCLIKMDIGSDSFLGSMPEKDLIAWNAVITGHSENGDNIEAVSLFPLMHEEGVGVNQTTLSTVLKSVATLRSDHICSQIHAFSVKAGFESDNYVASSLIDTYGKCGYIEAATNVFKESPFVDLVAFTSMITAYSQGEQGEDALKLYLEMQDRDIKPDSFLCSSLLNACANLSPYEQGKQIHVHALKVGFMSDIFAGNSAGNSLVNIYAKCPSIIQSDANRGVPPNHITLVSVLCACIRAVLVVEAQQYFKSMKKSLGIEPMQEHYACMIDLLGRAGKLDEEFNAISSKCLKPEKSGTHVLLANIYASAGMWDNVAKMRRLVKDSKVKKEPGISWIEIKDKVYTFIARDRSHSRSKEIYAMLDELRYLLNKAGYVPMLEIDLHDVEQIAFGLIATPPGAPVRVKKNLRICLDCHIVFKYICKTVSREIIVRDFNRLHHFRDG
ncbi:hypothetical protein P3X46_020290 [Hevea brasiliensis]|uniref:DYW domain-containing protein n=1 Tax=Hevea brasiliensis TaxID=3981 RepID=A0ABQ9LLF9_HEVBR|nr:hypothetical protein P3X46_020290 [Hevea brasiliensis]